MDSFKINKSNLSLYSLYYAEACSELAGSISASLRPGNTAPFKEMLQRWRAVGNTVSDMTGRVLNLRPPAPKTNALPLDQVQFNSVSRISKKPSYLLAEKSPH